MQKNKDQYDYDEYFVANLTTKVIDSIVDNPENMCKLLNRISKYIKSIDTLSEENKELKKDKANLNLQLKRVMKNYDNETKERKKAEDDLAELKDDFELQLKQKDAVIERLEESLQAVAIENIKNNTQENEILENEGRSNIDIFLSNIKKIKDKIKKNAQPAVKILREKKYSSIANFKALLYLYTYEYLALILEGTIGDEQEPISFKEFLSSAPILKDHIEILKYIEIERSIHSLTEEIESTDIRISITYNNKQLLQSIKDGKPDFVDHQDELIASALVTDKDGKPICDAIKII